MKKLILLISLLTALFPRVSAQASRAVGSYDAAAAKVSAQNDLANWMSYLPDDVFVAHLSIPGTHDTTTGHGFNWTGAIAPGIMESASRTQTLTLSQQLEKGVRAFDFRPGLSSDKKSLTCNHGISYTKLSMTDAFNTLTDYLDAHPKEFFVIHLFRGNVYQSGAPYGAFDSQSDKNKYNELFNEFFNQGKFNDYIVEYTPYLKVKDMRGKMVIFRRDRIDFAYIAKAGNFGTWRSDSELWTEESLVSVSNAKDPTVRGTMAVTDVSSPENDDQLQTELNSIAAINKFAREQVRPNEAKTANSSYKPTLVMCFTSGALYNENRTGYAQNASHTNPHLTNLIKQSAADGKAGPTGIVLSDWVYVTEDSGYKTDGETADTQIVPTIALNNFDYISEFILDDELFSGNLETAETFWDLNTQYIFRNKATGKFLSAGANWGTHAVLGDVPIRITPRFDASTGMHTLLTTFRQGNTVNYLGANAYIDNSEPCLLKVKMVGDKTFTFAREDGSMLTAVAADQGYADGTQYKVDFGVEVENDEMQQWEVVRVKDYVNTLAATASNSNPVDLTIMVRGNQFHANDGDNDLWQWKDYGDTRYCVKHTKNCWLGSNKDIVSKNIETDKDCFVKLHHNFDGHSVSSINLGKLSKWELFQVIEDLPDGVYQVKASIANYAVPKGGDPSKDEYLYLQLTGSYGSDSPKEVTTSIEYNAENKSGNFSDAAEYLKELRKSTNINTSSLVTVKNGKLEIRFRKGSNKSAVSVGIDNVKLIYLGPDTSEGLDFLKKVLADADAKVKYLSQTSQEEWKTKELINKYKTWVENSSADQIEGDGSKEAYEVYTILRELTYKVVTDGAADNTDLTPAIINNSFELGNGFGWNINSVGGTEKAVSDTKVVLRGDKDGTYYMSGSDVAGDYLFNTFERLTDNAEPRGTVLSQSIPGLPAGHYRLNFAAATTSSADEPRYLWVDINGIKTKSQPLTLDRANAQTISVEFDVAENTEEVTISVCGANADGSWDDYGGVWYKVDNFRLYYHGTTKVCQFYDRLNRAIQRFTALASTLPKKYSSQWQPTKYRHYYEEHLASHQNQNNPDPDDPNLEDPMNGSNGLKEIEEMYAELRALVLSQTEEGADMTGAILNQSFELGDMTGWTCEMDPTADTKVTRGDQEDVYKTSGLDKEYLFNTYLGPDPGTSAPLYQTVTGIPAGHYRLTALVASDAGNKFFLAADRTFSDMMTIPATTDGTEAKTKFHEMTVEFEVTDPTQDVTIGIYPSNDGSFNADPKPETKGPWFKADNFRLTLIRKFIGIDWTWTTPDHVYDTLILPFAADVPAGMEIYNTSGVDETVKSEDYQVLKLEKADRIEANTPYVVKRVEIVDDTESGAENEPQAAPARAPRAGAQVETYTFTGSAVNDPDQDLYKKGLLTGTLGGTKMTGGDGTMNFAEEKNFFLVNLAGTDEDVKPNHGYIAAADREGLKDALYLENYPDLTPTGVEAVAVDGELSGEVDVYTAAGVIVRRGVEAGNALEGLPRGIYIITDGRNTVKFLK